jgi:hypothetical protein
MEKRRDDGERMERREDEEEGRRRTGRGKQRGIYTLRLSGITSTQGPCAVQQSDIYITTITSRPPA